MVTFSSANFNSGPGNPKRKKKKAKKQATKSSKASLKGKGSSGYAQAQVSTAQKGPNYNKQPKKPKTKIQPGTNQKWSDLKGREKLKYTFKGKGKNTKDKNGNYNWSDHRIKVPKINNKVKKGPTPTVTSSTINDNTPYVQSYDYPWRYEQPIKKEEKDVKKLDEVKSWAEENVDENGLINTEKDTSTIEDPALKNILDDILDPSVEQEGIVKIDLNRDEYERLEQYEKHKAGDKVRVYEEDGEDYTTKILTQQEASTHNVNTLDELKPEDKDLWMSGGRKNAIPIDEFNKRLNEVYQGEKWNQELSKNSFDPDFDITSMDEIAETNPNLANRVSGEWEKMQNKKRSVYNPDLRKSEVKGSGFEDFKLMGIKWKGPETSKQDILIPEIDYSMPIPFQTEDGKIDFKYDYKFKESQIETFIGGEDQLVLARETPYGEIEVKYTPVPLIESAIDPYDDGFIIDANADEKREKYAPTPYEYNLMFEANAQTYIDELFQPDLDLLLVPSESDPNIKIVADFKNMEPEKAYEFFNTAVDNLKNRFENGEITVKEILESINSSEFASYGFFYDPIDKRLYADVAYDIDGVPRTADVWQNLYTGDVLNTDGKAADFIQFTDWYGYMPEGVKEDDDGGLRALQEYNTESGYEPSYVGWGFIFPWLKQNQETIADRIKEGGKADFNNTAVGELQDILNRANYFKQRYDQLLEEIQNDPTTNSLSDNINKTSNTKLQMDNVLNEMASSFQSYKTETKKLKQQFAKLEKDPKSREKGSKTRKQYVKLGEEINNRIDNNNIIKDKYKQVLATYNSTPINLYSVQYLDADGNQIYKDNTSFNNPPANASGIEQTVLTSPGNEISFTYPKDATTDGGLPLIIREKDNFLGDSSGSRGQLPMSGLQVENKVDQISLHDEMSKLNDKIDFSKNMLTKTIQSLNSAQKAAEQEMKNMTDAISEKGQTWAQDVAFVFNRIVANGVKMLAGLPSLGLEITKLQHMLTQAILEGAGADELAALEGLLIEATQNTISAMNAAVDQFIEDELTVKPGGFAQSYDLQDWDTTGYQVLGLVTDVAFDIVVTVATSGASKASTIGRLVNWVDNPSRLKWLGRKNAQIMDAYKAGKINKRQAITLSAVENTPISILTRLHVDSVVSLDESIKELEARTGKKVNLSPMDRSIIEFFKPGIEAYMDKIGIEALGNSQAMSRLATYITGRAAKNEIKGIGLKQFVKNEIDQLVKSGAITYVNGLAFNVADETVQEMVNMLIEKSQDDKLRDLGWEQTLFNSPDFGSEEYNDRLIQTAKVSFYGIGIVNKGMVSVNVISNVKSVRNRQKWLENHVAEWSTLKSKEVVDVYLKQLEVLRTQTIDKITNSAVNESVKKKKIEEAEIKFNEQKASLLKTHDILQKVDITLSDDVAAQQVMLESELYDLKEKLKGELPYNIKLETEQRIKEIEDQLNQLFEATTTQEGDVKTEFTSEKSQQFTESQNNFLNKIEKAKDEDVDVKIFDTNEEAEAYAKSIGTTLKADGITQQAKYIKKDKVFIFSKEAYLLNRANKQLPKFDHELDHYFVDVLEDEFGVDITLKIAEQIASDLQSGALEFDSPESEQEFKNLINAYIKLDPENKQMQADEIIANARDFMREGKLKSIDLDTLKDIVSNELSVNSDGILESQEASDVDFLKLLDLMGEDADLAKEEIKKTIPKKPTPPPVTKKTKRKQPKSILDPIGQGLEEVEADRFALIDNEAEKKKIISQIKDLIKDKDKNKDKISRLQERIKELNKGIQNAEDVATIENPNSGPGAKQRAENRLDANNKEAIVQFVVNSKMTGNEYTGTVETKDGEKLSYSIPRSEIEEALRSTEYPNIYNAFFKRKAKFKDMPFGLKVKNDLILRWQQVVDPLIQKDIREQRDIEEGTGKSLLDGTDSNLEESLEKVEPKKAAKINMRKAMGILEGSDIFEKVKEGVVNTFKGVLPEVKTNKLKKALEKSYATQSEQSVRLLIDEMGGVEPFLETYGEEVYEAISQSAFNKSYPEFNKPGRRLSTTEFDKLVSEGLIDKKEAKTARTAGYFLYEKQPYNKKKFIESFTKPEKGTTYSKKNGLVSLLAKELSKDATMEVLSDSEIMEMYNERNDLLNQARVTINEVAEVIDKNPDSRFALDGVAEKIQQKLYQTFADAVRTAGKDANKIDVLETKLSENFSEEMLEMFDDVIEPLKALFRDAVSGYKKRLKSKVEDSNLPEDYKKEVEDIFENKTMSKGKGTETSMKEMHKFQMDFISKLPAKLVESLKGANFFSYIYNYLDGGKKKGGGFGPFKSQLDEVNKVISKLKNQEELDFNPEDIELMNAAYGVLGRAETILDKDISKEEKLEELGLEEDGTVKPGSILDKIQRANEVNTKAIEYLMTKAAESIASDSKNIKGFLRWLESMTNNTKSLRALSKVNDMEVHSGSQAAFVNLSTGQTSNSLTDAQKKDNDWVINFNHARYDEAKEYAEEIYKDTLVNKEAKIKAKTAELLKYKGEHIDVASNLMADMVVDVLEAADKLRKAQTDLDKEGIIESLKNKIALRLDNYSQSHVTKLDADLADAKGGSTNTTQNLRYELMGPDSENKVSIANPRETFDPVKATIPTETIQEVVDQNKDVIESIEDTQKPKSRDRLALEKTNAPVVLEGDLTGPEVLSKMKTLDALTQKARDKRKTKPKKARVFDFDDTIANTNSKVFYTMPDGTEGVLTAEEFAKDGDKIREQGGEFDFSDFNRVVEGKQGPLFDLLKQMKDAKGKRDIFILTARAPESAKAIHEWLKSQGVDIPLENITGLGNSSPQAKAEWFIGKYIDEDYNDFYFADDHLPNVEAVSDVLDIIDVKSKTQQAKERFALDGEKIAKRLFKMVAKKAKKDPETIKDISNIKAQIKGRKRFENPMAPSSTQNFTGLLYKFLGKGQEGNEDFEFLKDNLVRPYTRALNDLAAFKNSLLADFNATLDNFVGKGKAIPNLNEEAPGLGGYTYEDAIRILAWDNQGIQADGVPKTTMDKIRVMSRNNPALKRMADQLVNITKGDGYYYPGLEWGAGSMMGDLMQGVSRITRARLLSEWNQNIETIFGKDNGSRYDSKLMNAIEYQYGTKYRKSFEDMLRRMKSGRNRRIGNSAQENKFYDWLNNSVGAVMFFNMRSGILQTLSAANYINWSFNNPAKAAAAFANQPQYWKDFMDLFNSDFLLDRRGGNKINISESEIFDATHNQSNKPKAFLNLLLRKGFSITQVADSFAIASGGATFYRNRIKDLTKKGMSEDEASAQAYEEWTALSREAQQSSDAMEVSSQQAGGLGRTILAFANTPMQYNRIIGKAISDLANGRGDWKSNVSRIAYYGALQNIMFNALQQAVFAAIGNGDEDELDEKTLNTLDGMLTSLLRGMGVGGSIVAALKDVGLDIYDRTQKPRPEYYKAVFEALNIAPPLDVKVSKFVRAMNTYEYNEDSPKMKDYLSVDNPLYMSGALLTASVTNIPLDRLLQKMINIKDALAQDQENWKRVALLMGWSEWQLESSAQQEERKEVESDEKHYYKALENPSLYNKSEQEDILRQHGYSQEEIDGMKKQDDRVEAILKAEKSSGKKYTSKIPTEKSIQKEEEAEPAIVKEEKVEVEKAEEKPQPKVEAKPKQAMPKQTKPKKVNFTENTSFKNNRVPVEKRNKQELKLYELPAAEQKDSLKSLGLSDAEIKALKYEGDRVRKILELQK